MDQCNARSTPRALKGITKPLHSFVQTRKTGIQKCDSTPVKDASTSVRKKYPSSPKCHAEKKNMAATICQNNTQGQQTTPNATCL